MQKPILVTDTPGAISTGFNPRRHQHELYLALKRFSVIICHRRFGKSVLAVNLLVDQALRSTKPLPRFAYIAPNYAQAKRVVWDYIKQFCDKIPGVSYNEAELRVDFPHNNARLMLLSAETPASLKGIYLDYVVLDEYGDMTPVVWREVVRPTLSDRYGKALFIGTVKGRNHFWEMYEHARDSKDAEWYAAMYRASETKIIPESELESARKTMTEEEYAQEFECDPLAGNVGAYFAREMAKVEREGGLRPIEYDPTIDVDTGWDLGINDVTAIWFYQSVRGHRRFIDYFETSGLSIPEIVHELKGKKYRYGEMFLPHDSNSRDINTGKTTTQLIYKEGLRHIRVIPRVKVKRVSINAAKMLLPSCSFDPVKCAKGIKALQNYKRKWDEKTQSFADTPLHDWSSNAADAFQQIALGIRGDSAQSGTLETRVPSFGIEAEMAYNPYGVG